MKLFNWIDILSLIQSGTEDPFFSKGSGISIGSFDGLHKGHRVLLKELKAECQKNSLKSGVFSFIRPLPSIKHSVDYMGDVSTLEQRLALFEELGMDFAIIAEFDDSFASMMGTDFLNLLHNFCNMEVLAEGIDFRCGYKGATDTQAIRYWGEKNNVRCVFVDPVYYREGTDEEERVSSSYIRQMIQKGFFSTVEELLERPYEIDLKEKENQIIPLDGIYRTVDDKGEDVRLEIKNGSFADISGCRSLKFL